MKMDHTEEKRNKLSKPTVELHDILQKFENHPRYILFRLKKEWENIVGSLLAEKSFVANWEDGIVTVKTDNSVWMNQLFITRNTIKKRIREKFPQQEIKEINFLTSQRKSKKNKEPSKTEKIWQKAELSPEEISKIKVRNQFIPSSELKKSLENLQQAAQKINKEKRINGWLPCTRCATLTDSEDQLCITCALQKEKYREAMILQAILANPSITFEELEKKLQSIIVDTSFSPTKENFFIPEPCTEKEYYDSRNYLIARILDHIYYCLETEEEKWLIVKLLTRNPDISVEHRDNIIAKFKRHTDKQKNEK